MIAFVFAEGDKLIISLVLSSYYFGVYSVALKIAVVTTLGLMAFNAKSKHLFSEFYKSRSIDKIQSLENTGIKLSLPIPLVALVVWVSMYLYGVESIMGWKFEDLFLVGFVLMFYQVLSMSLGPVNSIVSMCGHPDIVYKARIIGWSVSCASLLPLFFYDDKVILIVANYAGLNLILWKVAASIMLAKKEGIKTGFARWASFS